jgi:hypothetical protein
MGIPALQGGEASSQKNQESQNYRYLYIYEPMFGAINIQISV